MAQPLVSVLISNYNYGRYLPRAIDSALGQTYQPCEIIVIDDGSTDDSRQIIEGYGNRIIPILQSNGGQASALNTGFTASRGDVICLLDADDVWLPTKVERVVTALKAYPKASVVYHRVQTVDQLEQRRGQPWPPYPVIRGSIAQQVMDTGGWWPFPPSTGLSFPRSFIAKVIPIPELEYHLCADAYLADLAPFFGEVIGIEDALSLFRIHSTNHWSHPIEIQRRSLHSHELRVKVLNRTLQSTGIQAQISLQQHWPYQRLKHNLGEGKSLLMLSQLALNHPWELRLTSRLKLLLDLWIKTIWIKTGWIKHLWKKPRSITNL
ncbi:glycosyltransferase family 2 protein [Thermocoleostomius sinensis]|uniref:Glycosyltransferase n=1 Tax=Thermocoleostomius sinensis A174 TaxID=2016057 RepID=A0A9E9C3P2_9CYAN|nr:glycosyltransferase [Thermocoleostomius sinensis]WAL59161.1 glycosyltransferase [Thermocoleostomius sinensis A174]